MLNGLAHMDALPVGKAKRSGQPFVRSRPEGLFDTELIPTASISELNFFSKPYGQQTAYGSLTKNYGETNLKQAGMLPHPQSFTVMGFNIKYFPNTAGTVITPADFDKIRTGSWLEFVVGDKVYLTCPLSEIPCGVDVDGFGSVGSSSQILRNGMAHRSNIKPFTVGKYAVHLNATESFGVNLKWTTGIVLGAITRVLVIVQGVKDQGL